MNDVIRDRALRERVARGMLNTIPIVVAGTMAMSLTGPLNLADEPKLEPHRASDDRVEADRSISTDTGREIRAALAAAHAASTAEATAGATISIAAAAPATYRVVSGDTVSSIAGRFGLPTASVLALNGLGWKSTIYAGQTLKLTGGGAAPVAPVAAAPAAPAASGSSYTIVRGDTIGAIAKKFGVATSAVLSANGLGWSSIIYPGKTLAIPGVTRAAAVSATPIAPTTPAVSVTPIAKTGSTAHVIASGDTIGSIAKSYGVSVQSLLNANGLSWSSIIYSGRTLTIPGVTVATAPSASVTALTPAMAANATTIISVGRSLGVSDYGIVIALSAAMQESSLINIAHGDRDSLGLFQQRPSSGWGTTAQIMDPTHAAKLFYGGPTNPNAGRTRGLLEIPGWQTKTVTQAAQAVQISGHPDAYAKWETSAWSWLDQLT